MLSFFNRPFFRHPIIVIAMGILILWSISISLPILLAYLTALLLEPIIVRMCKRFRKKRKIVVFFFFYFF